MGVKPKRREDALWKSWLQSPDGTPFQAAALDLAESMEWTPHTSH